MPDPTTPATPPGPAPSGPAPAAPAPGAAAAPAGPTLPPCGPDEVALLIDDRPVVVKKGTNILEAAAGLGVEVPHYCYHPGLSIAGNCRMCLVEIEKMPKLQIGCATTVAQGMVVKTTTPRVQSTRAGMMEFLLINHPLDCPICDQAGECRLQQYSAEYGTGQSRFVEEKVHHDKRVPIGARVVFDGERCIKCTRCVRFCEEVTGTRELTLVDRGGHAIIDTFPGKPLDNDYSGNTVDICPVGALTWKPFRFQARVWFLKNVPSICTGCARGCNVDLAAYDHRVHRITPRHNPDVNGHWMCDHGRQTHVPTQEGPRLTRALARGVAPEAAAGPAAGDAIDRAAALLRAAASRHGKGSVAAVVSARLSIEDLHAARTTLKAAGIERVAVPPHDDGADDALLIRRDRTPNARGAALIGFGAPDAATTAALAGDIAAGRVKALLVIGEDPAGDGWLPASAIADLEALVVIDAFHTATAEAAQVALPSTAYGESEGVYVNCTGRAQRTRAAIRPQHLSEPVWAILADLGRRFGAASSWSSSAQVFDDVARTHPAFAGMSHRALGESGAPVRGE